MARPTIRDVARQAGVSISLVSYVLNDTPGQSIPKETRERVRQAAEALHYRPNASARRMRTKKTMTLALVSFWNIRNPVASSILSGVLRQAEAAGYNVLISDLSASQAQPEDEYRYADLFSRQIIDGVLLLSPFEALPHYDESSHVRLMRERRIPSVVLIGSGREEEDIPYVHLDYAGSVRLAVRYLVGVGHRRIGYLRPGREQVTQQQSVSRLAGWAEAVAENGLDRRGTDLFDCEELSLPGGFDRVRRLTAVVLNKTESAPAFYRLAAANGVRIPENLSVIACNSEPFDRFLDPPLTVVELPVSELGEEGARMLIARIDGRAPDAQPLPPCRLIPRASCRPL